MERCVVTGRRRSTTSIDQRAHRRGSRAVGGQVRQPLGGGEGEARVLGRPAPPAAIEGRNHRRRVEWRALGGLEAVAHEGGYRPAAPALCGADARLVDLDRISPLPVLEGVVLPQPAMARERERRWRWDRRPWRGLTRAPEAVAGGMAR
eukprot:scaffold48513_cov63-Phaeocystis_antarctica.AAC.4